MDEMNMKYRLLPCRPRYSAEKFCHELGERGINLHLELCRRDARILNTVLKGESRLSRMSMRELLYGTDVPNELKNDISHYAGSYISHSVFFSVLKPSGNGIYLPHGNFGAAIEKRYGTKEKFLRILKNTIRETYGSCFVWVVCDRNGLPEIIVCDRYSLPRLNRKNAVMALDCFEHAYTDRYGFDISGYADALLRLIDYDECEKRYCFSTGISYLG